MWLFYTLLAAILLGVGQIFAKKGLKSTTPLYNNVLTTILGIFLMIPYSLTHGVQFDKILGIVPLTIIAASLFLSYYYLINKGQISLTGTIIGTYPFFTVILSLLFLHEAPSVYQKLAIFLIIIGTIFVAMPDKVQHLKSIKIGGWLFWAICGILFIGTGDFLIKLLINQTDLYTYLFTYTFCSVFVTGLSFFIDKKGRILPPFAFKLYLPTLIGATIMETSFFVFHIAVSMGLLSLVSPICSIYVAITAILAWIVLKETINKTQGIGIALAALGVILIGIS